MALNSAFVVARSEEYSDTVLSCAFASSLLYFTSWFFKVLVTAFSWLTFSYSDCASASALSSFAKFVAKSDSTRSSSLRMRHRESRLLLRGISLGFTLQHGRGSIIIPQECERLSNPTQAQLQISLGLLVVC